MSELRDLTAALRATNGRLDGLEECMVVLLRNSVQESDWRHEIRGIEQRRQLEGEERDRALKQVQEACGAISHKLAELIERLDNQASVRLSDVKELRGRVNKLEEKAGEEFTPHER